MKKLKVIFLTATMFFFALSLQAQDTDREAPYKNAIGVVGHEMQTGITFKRFINKTQALEGWLTTDFKSLSSEYQNVSVTGLYEFHHSAFNVPGLYWFYGAGMHLGIFHYDLGSFDNEKLSGTHVYFGLDAVAGMEYNFKKVPLNVSLIYNPSINLSQGMSHQLVDGKLAIRYRF